MNNSVLDEYVENLVDCFEGWILEASEYGDDTSVRTLESCINYAKESKQDYEGRFEK